MEDLRFRKCPKCGQHKPIDDFRDVNSEMGRFYKNCRQCGGSVIPEWPDEKECPVCETVRPLKDFKRTPGRGRSSKICNFCNEKVEAEKEERRRELEKRKAEKKAALERWRETREPVQKKESNEGQTCPVCGVFKEFAKYRRQGVTQVTQETPCNKCIGTKDHEAWYSEKVKKYNRKKQREYRKKKKSS